MCNVVVHSMMAVVLRKMAAVLDNIVLVRHMQARQDTIVENMIVVLHNSIDKLMAEMDKLAAQRTPIDLELRQSMNLLCENKKRKFHCNSYQSNNMAHLAHKKSTYTSFLSFSSTLLSSSSSPSAVLKWAVCFCGNSKKISID